MRFVKPTKPIMLKNIIRLTRGCFFAKSFDYIANKRLNEKRTQVKLNCDYCKSIGGHNE